jgi:hypothetical protein
MVYLPHVCSSASIQKIASTLSIAGAIDAPEVRGENWGKKGTILTIPYLSETPTIRILTLNMYSRTEGCFCSSKLVMHGFAAKGFRWSK